MKVLKKYWPVMINAPYAVLGWFLFILFVLTFPEVLLIEPKFDNSPFERVLTVAAIVAYVIVEVLILRGIYRKCFESRVKRFLIYLVIHAVFYLVPLWF